MLTVLVCKAGGRDLRHSTSLSFSSMRLWKKQDYSPGLYPAGPALEDTDECTSSPCRIVADDRELCEEE